MVWEGAVKRILSRRELYRNVIAPVRRIWVVKSAVTSCSNLCPTNSSGSAPDYFRSAAHRSKRPLSQYFSSTDSALLWLRHCAECLNSPRRSLPAHRSTGSILLSSYASLFIRKRGLIESSAIRKQIATKILRLVGKVLRE